MNETRPMTDDEYAQERESGALFFCPCCRALKVEETDSLEWSDPAGSEEMARVRLYCNACKTRWTEILRPVGYELESDGKPC